MRFRRRLRTNDAVKTASSFRMARCESQPHIKPLRIDAGVVRQQLDQLAAPGAASVTAHCTICSPMPRLRQWLATRTSSISAREAPCELNPGRMQSCRQPTTTPHGPPRPRAGYWNRARPPRTPGNRTVAADLRAARARGRANRRPALHDGPDIFATGAPDGDGRNRSHPYSRRTQRAQARPLSTRTRRSSAAQNL